MYKRQVWGRDKAKEAIDSYTLSLDADENSVESYEITHKALSAIVLSMGHLCYERHGRGIYHDVEPKPPSEAV